MKSSLNGDVSPTCLKSSIRNLWDFPSPHKLFTSQYLRSGYSLFSSIFVHLLVINFRLSMNSVLIAFVSTVNNISISVTRSNFGLVFFKAPWYANFCAVRTQAGSSLYISRHTIQKFSNTSVNNNVLLWT